MEAGPGNNESQRGALIVVEGLDRAGKSTQCAILQKALQEEGHEVKYRRFPGTCSCATRYSIIPGLRLTNRRR